MHRYANLSGNSGVTHYEIGPDFIDVRYLGGEVYRYSGKAPGAALVEQMKVLAVRGRGLCGFVSRNVRAYDRKLESTTSGA